ncbi:MAG: hypothetical protein WCQ90_09465, partial [Deltaproteobacteria bacterium]
TQQWKYKNSSSGGLLNTMEVGKAYWIYITKAEGVTLSNTGSEIAHKITLKPGWNFAGFNKLTETTIASAISTINGKFSIIWGDFNPSTQQWKYKNSSSGGLLNNMNPTKGYWIYNNTTENISWEIP